MQYPSPVDPAEPPNSLRLSRRQMLALSGSALTSLALAGCSGGSVVKSRTENTAAARSVLLAVNPSPALVTNDRGVATAFLGFLRTLQNDFAAYWGTRTAAGAPVRITQSLFWDADPANGTRVLFDGQNLPVRVEHQQNGAFVLIFWETARAVFKFYQPDGSYIGGAAVTPSGANYNVTRLPDTQIVGYYSGTLSGLRDAIVTFTIGGTVNRPTATTTARGRQTPPTGQSMTAEEFTQAKQAVTALAGEATLLPTGFAGGLLQAIATPLLASGASPLGTRILTTALNGTGIAPVFLEDGLPILFGLATPLLLRSLAADVQRQSAQATQPPAALKLAYSSPDPVAYRSVSAFTQSRPAGDPTGVRGIVASRELDTVAMLGFIEPTGALLLRGTARNGAVVELRGTVANKQVQNGRWQVSNLPTAAAARGRQNGGDSGDWDADETPLGQCTQQQSSGGQGIFSQTYDLGRCGDFSFSYQAFTIPDQFQVYQEDNLLFDTGGKVSGGSTVNLTAIGDSTLIRVVVTADESGTAWNYTVGCPQ